MLREQARSDFGIVLDEVPERPSLCDRFGADPEKVRAAEEAWTFEVCGLERVTSVEDLDGWICGA